MTGAEKIENWRKRANDYDPEALIPASQLARESHLPSCHPHGSCYCALNETIRDVLARFSPPKMEST